MFRREKTCFFLLVCQFTTPSDPSLQMSSLAGQVRCKEFPTRYLVYRYALDSFAEEKRTARELLCPVDFIVERNEI